MYWLDRRHRQQAGSYRGSVHMCGMSERIKEGQRGQLKSQVGFQAASAAVAVVAPSRGRAQVLRSGQPGKDAGLAAHGQGWPIAAGPRSRTGARACRALARHRTKGARALWLLSRFSKVTRCKSETNSSRYRRNGYVPHPTTHLKTPGRCPTQNLPPPTRTNHQILAGKKKGNRSCPKCLACSLHPERPTVFSVCANLSR